jgi:hypothetical protein
LHNIKLHTIDKALFHQVAGFIFDYIFNNKPRDLGSPNSEKLVEYGFARFGDLYRTIVVDEPLVLLAAVNHLCDKTAVNLRHFLLEGLLTSNGGAQGISFEHFGAFLLAIAFREPQPLSSVFEFHGSHQLQDESAQLVAIEKANGQYVCTPVDILSDTRPMYTMGHTSTTADQTLSWVRNPRRSVFCFPVKAIGPDLLLVLRLSDARVLRVVVRFKQINQPSLGLAETQAAFHTTGSYDVISQSSEIPTSQVIYEGDSNEAWYAIPFLYFTLLILVIVHNQGPNCPACSWKL